MLIAMLHKRPPHHLSHIGYTNGAPCAKLGQMLNTGKPVSFKYKSKKD